MRMPRSSPARWLDVVLAGATAGLGLWRELAVTPGTPYLVVAPAGLYLAVHVLSALLLLRRRQHPELVAAILAGLCLLTPTYAAFAMPYSVAVYAENRRRIWLPLLALAVGWALGARIWALADPYAGLAAVLIAALLGLYVRARRGLVQALVERAERAEREQEYLAEQARVEERVRLAAEMHDIVAHRVNLMVLQAGALSSTASDETVRQAAEVLRQSGYQALAELRELTDVLRSGPGSAAPRGATGPPVPDVAALVAESRSAGVDVELTEHGDPDVTSPAVQRTAYRVVQESLTNVRKHAPGAAADVDLSYGPEDVRATVVNGEATKPVDPELAASGSGSGLVGLRQRVELLKGTLAAGPAENGGFAVDAQLPVADRRSAERAGG